MRHQIESLLLSEVSLPGQYIGGELGSIVKPKDSVRGRLCFAFPDVYTIGMSNHGLQLIYALMNRRADWACERAFAPYPDMEKALRKHKLPLYFLETFSPLSEFDRTCQSPKRKDDESRKRSETERPDSSRQSIRLSPSFPAFMIFPTLL